MGAAAVVTSRQAPGHVVWVNHFAVPPDQPGGTRHAELGSALARMGWDVTIVASDFHLHTRRYFARGGPSDRRAKQVQVGPVTFLWLWAAPYHGNDWRRLLNLLTFAVRVAALPGPLTASVVIGSTPDLFTALGAWVLARRKRLPFVLEVRDLWPESLQAVSGRRGPMYHVLRLLAAWLYGRAEHIIVVVDRFREVLHRHGIPDDRISHVPNGVDPAAFPHRPPVAGRSFTVAYAGAHGPANGLDVVLEAAELLRNRSDIRFVLIGDGPVKPALQAEVARRGLTRVEFRDPVPKAGVNELLRQADAGLMVLRGATLFAEDVSPNKLFDYLAAALPVICNVPGAQRILDESGAGEMVPPEDPAALAGAIVRLAECPVTDRLDRGARGRDWVLREHDRGRLASRVSTALEDLVQADGFHRQPGPSWYGRTGKRLMDLVIAVPVLTVSVPLLLAIAGVLALTMGWPVLFVQRRAGLNGRPFNLVKLRTMREAVDATGAARPDAERLTWIGRLLRRLSLDELPQIWNVLRGDMSLVGPRPLLLEYLPLYSPAQARRHEVRPGITGWAQIHGRNATTWDDRLRLDAWYVDHQSLGLDLWILVRTAAAVLTGQGVNQPGGVTMEPFRGSGT